MKKMTFNLFGRFILWLKKIFRIRPKVKRPPKIPSEKEPVEAKPNEEKTPEVPPKKKIQKPYKKKALTKKREKERKKPSEEEKKLAYPIQRKEIDLGSAKRKKRRETKQPQRPAEVSIERTDTVPEEKEALTRVEAPFVEIDLDEVKVSLIIPKQQFKPSMISNIPQQLHYKLELNGKKQTISVKVSENEQGIAKVEERRIELEKPLKNFKVVFPDELQGRTYGYKHDNGILYAFVAIGNNRGRMYYLYDKYGNINSLPQRAAWILLNEDFELKIEPDVIEVRWLWERYRPLRVNLSKMDELVVKNTQSGRKERLSCETTFSIEGEQLIEDDFKEQIPLFIGENIKIKAPRENPSGWMVWIQNKIAGYRIISENWNGIEPLGLKLPDVLPCECGEFQVDFCQQDTRLSDETLFFRWIPFIKLAYPKELIIPNSHHGHISEFLKIKLGDFQKWELEIGSDIKVTKDDGFFKIEIPPEKDTFRFSIAKKGKPETNVRFQITTPRLKWKTSKQRRWNDRPQKIKRGELIPGEDLNLFISTNDFNTKYDLLAMLETNGQKLQEAMIVRRGMDYILLLNQFYDTIKQNKDEKTLGVKIRKTKSDQLLGKVDTLYFPGESLIKKTIPRQKIQQKKPIMRYVSSQAMVKGGRGRIRRGKGFSKQEIIGAGINMSDIRRLGIRFDKRRKSFHPWNIKTLKLLIGGDKYADRSS